MGRVLRTTGKLAKNPYRIQKIERNIYSLEELCYSLVQSAQFLDAEIMDPVLVQWLREECGLPDLAERLGGYLGKERLLPDFTSAILNHAAYMTKDRQLRTRKIISSGQGMEPFERKAAHAEYLAGEGRAYEALQEYESLLSQLPEPERRLRTKVYRKMGMILCELFRFRTASEHFYRAYTLSGSKEDYLTYLTAVRMKLSEEEYVAFVSEHPEAYDASLELETRMQTARRDYAVTEGSRQIEMLRIYQRDGQTTNFHMELTSMIGKMKEQYRKTKALSV
ncbi:MAG: hypothetical protein IJI62_08445 [Lachnospiraceae bacterium]|nr:hypothetical protein [Lachnospiraceae bacterium]MBQ6364020.1 hypothetical protein [Lachnospiraceae bacterium]